MIIVKVKSVRESKLEELTQDQFNKWDSARQQQWLKDHPNSKFKPQGQTKQDIASKYDASNDEDGTKWTGVNPEYKDKLVKDYKKAPDKRFLVGKVQQHSRMLPIFYNLASCLELPRIIF